MFYTRIAIAQCYFNRQKLNHNLKLREESSCAVFILINRLLILCGYSGTCIVGDRGCIIKRVWQGQLGRTGKYIYNMLICFSLSLSLSHSLSLSLSLLIDSIILCFMTSFIYEIYTRHFSYTYSNAAMQKSVLIKIRINAPVLNYTITKRLCILPHESHF